MKKKAKEISKSKGRKDLEDIVLNEVNKEQILEEKIRNKILREDEEKKKGLKELKQQIKDELIKDFDELLSFQKKIRSAGTVGKVSQIDVNQVSKKDERVYEKKILAQQEKQEQKDLENQELLRKKEEQDEINNYSVIPKWKKNMFY